MSRLLISAMRPFSARLASVAATMAGDVSEFRAKSTGPAHDLPLKGRDMDPLQDELIV